MESGQIAILSDTGENSGLGINVQDNLQPSGDFKYPPNIVTGTPLNGPIVAIIR